MDMAETQGANRPAPESSPEQQSGLVNEGAAAPQDNVAGEDNQSPELSDRAQKRFDQLTGKLKGESEARHALELELAELRGRVSQGEQAQDPWASVSNEELLSISVQENATAEQKAEALRRYNSRIDEKISKFEQRDQAEQQFQAELEKTWEGIRQDFGDAVDDRSSPIYNKATEIYGQYRDKHGANVVDSDPRYQRMAFEVAGNLVSSNSQNEIDQLRAELAKYKQGETIEAAGNLASSSMARTNQAVKSGDAKTMGADIAKRLLGGPPVI